MRIERYRKTRYWAVLDRDNTLVCLCVYRKGAEAVIRRLQAVGEVQEWQGTHDPAERLKSSGGN